MDLFKKSINKLKSYKNLPILIAFFFFTLASVYITYPLIFHLSDYISGLTDQLYINWIINWNIYSFTNNIGGILNTNIFYPYQGTLAYSDIYILVSLIAFIPVKIIEEPAVAYNFIFIFSLVTLGFFTYLLTLYITKDHFSSFVGGTITAFSSYTLAKYMHLQLLSMACVSLSILFFVKFLDTKKYKYLVVSSLFFLFQMYNSFLPAYFILFSNLIIMFFYRYKKKFKISDFNIKKTLLLLFFVVLFSLPVVIPYYRVSNEFSYTRDIRESIHNSNRLEYTFFPGDATRLGGFLAKTFYQGNKGPYFYDGYIGLIFYILFPFSFIYMFFVKKKGSLLFNSFLVIGLSSFILSLGPALQWGGRVIKLPFIIPLPYALLYYLVPGFNGLRNPARWEMLYLLSISICIGIFLSEYFKNKTKVFAFLLSALICLLVILEFKFPYTYYKIPTKEQFPRIYSYIKSLPVNSVIAQFPIYNWDTFTGGLFPENVREYYYTLSFPKTINGTAGFDPPPWQDEIRFLIKNFPNNKSISLLRKIGVNYIIVNYDEFNSIQGKKDLVDNKIFPNASLVRSMIGGNIDLKLLQKVDNSYVYKIN